MQPWTTFWNEQRTFSRGFLRGNAALFIARSRRLLELRPDDVVLDLGSSFGQIAGDVAPRVAEYCGVDASERSLAACPRFMTRLRWARFERLELSRDPLPPAHSACGYTLVIGHSVLQYLPSQAAVDRLVDDLSRVAASNARLLFADLPGEHSILLDAGSQLWHGLRGGYAPHVLWALAAAPLFGYGRTRRRHGVLAFSEARLREIGARFGGSVEVLSDALTANASRRHLFASRRSAAAHGDLDASER
jgi:SAM-dependent methyltransferase